MGEIQRQLTKLDINAILRLTMREEGHERWWNTRMVFDWNDPKEYTPNELWEQGEREWVMRKVINYLDMSFT